MLNPNRNRLDYGKLLSPPEGYELDFAVGTSYSLDLNALLGACLSLGLHEDTDSTLVNNPIFMLEALRSTSDKIALFCEGGQIKVPNRPTKLFILLEKIVFTIQTKKTKGIAHYPSFHPKFWLIRYTKDHDVIYRVIVLSRNLTFDRSWDVAFSMDGVVRNKKRNKNQTLCDFLSYLKEFLPNNENGRNKANEIDRMIEEIPYIVFELEEDEFEDYKFIPHGIDVSNRKTEMGPIGQTDLFQNTYHDLLVISPFLSNDIMKILNERRVTSKSKHDYTLISTKNALSKLKEENVSNFDLYILKDMILNGDEEISEDQANELKEEDKEEDKDNEKDEYDSIESRISDSQDIHAKLYMTKKYSDVFLYMGSFNASRNAMHGNVEFMIQLKCNGRLMNPARLKKELFGDDPEGKDNPFTQISLSQLNCDEDKEKEKRLDLIIKEIDRLKSSAIVEEDRNHYRITVSFSGELPEGDITIQPLLSNKKEKLDQTILFTGLEILQLSEFYEITVNDEDKTTSRIIMIPTKGIPERREEEVVNSVFGDEDDFYRYIAFVLADSALMGSLDVAENDINAKGYKYKGKSIPPAIYEKLLQAVSNNPDRLDGIEYLLKTVTKEDVIPDEFEDLYRTIRKAIK